MRYLLITIVALTFLSGCFATAKYFPSGGSRSDGVVELVCNYDALTRCETTTDRGMDIEALIMCRRWGYDGAQPFGSYINQPGLNGTGQVRISYQCTGDIEK